MKKNCLKCDSIIDAKGNMKYCNDCVPKHYKYSKYKEQWVHNSLTQYADTPLNVTPSLQPIYKELKNW